MVHQFGIHRTGFLSSLWNDHFFCCLSADLPYDFFHKKKEYTGDNIDRLSAFKIAAALQNCDPKAALAGMMSKHVVSLYDMCYSTLLHFDMEQWDEKITDCINYLILLKALVKEEQAYGSH